MKGGFSMNEKQEITTTFAEWCEGRKYSAEIVREDIENLKRRNKASIESMKREIAEIRQLTKNEVASKKAQIEQLKICERAEFERQKESARVHLLEFQARCKATEAK